MFIDKEPGMGIWTRHCTDDGRVYYYNMMRNESKWEYEFYESTENTLETDMAMRNNVNTSYSC